jgi:hypothetical protein
VWRIVVNTARTVGTRAARQEHETSVAEEQTPTNGHPPSEIFDQQTGELLAEQQTGAYGGWTVYLDEEVVDSLPSQPPQPLEPPCQTGHDAIGHHIPGGLIANGAPLKKP